MPPSVGRGSMAAWHQALSTRAQVPRGARAHRSAAAKKASRGLMPAGLARVCAAPPFPNRASGVAELSGTANVLPVGGAAAPLLPRGPALPASSPASHATGMRLLVLPAAASPPAPRGAPGGSPPAGAAAARCPARLPPAGPFASAAPGGAPPPAPRAAAARAQSGSSAWMRSKAATRARVCAGTLPAPSANTTTCGQRLEWLADAPLPRMRLHPSRVTGRWQGSGPWT